MEYMHDKVNEVEQHPAPSLQTFRVVNLESFLSQHFNYVFPYRPDMCVRSSARNDEVVGHVGDAVKIQQYNVVGLHVEAQARGSLCSVGYI